MRKQLLLTLSLGLGVATTAACSSTDNSCEGAGDCPAGSICTEGECQAVSTPGVDGGSNDAGMSLYDAGPRHDIGPRPDARPPVSTDAGGSGPGPQDGGGNGGNQDSGVPNAPDIGMPVVLTLGDPCDVPDPDAGVQDPCSIDNPSYYCLPSIDGQSGYCSGACAYEPEDHHNGVDAGPHGHEDGCGEGCCVLIPAQVPGELDEARCRFRQDCQ